MRRYAVMRARRTSSRNAPFHRRPAGPGPTVHPIADLQQSIGNRAVGRLIGSPYIQAKLKVSTPGDSHEQEADRVADMVMRMPEPAAGAGAASPSRAQTSGVQRKCSECEEKAKSEPLKEKEEEEEKPPIQKSAVGQPFIQRLCSQCSSEMNDMPDVEEEEEVKKPAEEGGATSGVVQRKAEGGQGLQVSSRAQSQIDALRGGGQPLPESARSFFEPRLGHDFSGVRLHTGPQAAKAAQSINALAFTVGKDVAFGAGQYSPETSGGKRLLAHELTHVVQQGGAGPRTGESRSPAALQRSSDRAVSPVSGVVQRAGDPTAIPPTLPCPTDIRPGRPAGTEVNFGLNASTITPAQTAILTTFVASWVAAGGTDDILVHGFASEVGDQGPNWTLSCNRALAVQAELIRLGVPPVHIDVVAHGESTDFGAAANNQVAVVSTSAAGFFSNPLVLGILRPRDNFAGRSATRFGVGEVIDLDFLSIPPRPAGDFGGLEWVIAAGGGALAGVSPAGTATYTAPGTAAAVTLELRVATGPTAGRVVATRAITIVEPSGVRMVDVPGTAPGFANPGVVPPGTWGAGFQANVFVDPRDVSFQGVVFGEGTVVSVVTPPGSFQSPFAGLAHPVNTFGPAHGGNATTGTPVSPPVDNITTGQLAPTGTFLGLPTCGTSDFLWAIPWEFQVGAGPRTPIAGFTANHHATSSFFCNATIEKGGAGPFCRRINGAPC